SLSALIVAAYVAALVIGFGATDLPDSVVAMGRTDDTSSLTGRGPLWQELLEDYVPQRALAGFGYGAFWSADHIAELSKSQSWAIQSTHSSYIDLLLNVGIIGAVLCLSAMVWACVRALLLERRERRAGYGFIAMIVAYGLADGLGE